MERETGIEPATNSLEGCDSTTELLPPTRLTCSLSSAASGRPAASVSLARRARLASPQNRSRSRERKMVAREGLEPSKPLGRQIYSLLRLTASLPRQSSVVIVVSSVPRRSARRCGAGEGIRTPDLLITNQLLYQTELRQPRQKVNFSTSRASGAIRATSIS